MPGDLPSAIQRGALLGFPRLQDNQGQYTQTPISANRHGQGAFGGAEIEPLGTTPMTETQGRCMV
jgi:hypothetical protein